MATTPALVPLAGALITVETVRQALQSFFPRMRLRQQAWLAGRVAGGAIPGATDQDVLEALALENELQTEFERRVEERVLRDLGSILSAPAEEQRPRLTKLFERERRFAEQRAVEMGRRLEKTTERVAVKRESARGAFWELGEAKEHTPECVAMSGKLWSWEALAVLHPPVGPGCKCKLTSEKAAILAGKLMPGQTPRSAPAAERILIIHGRHHGSLAELREAIHRTGLVEDSEEADAALLRWAAEVAA